MSQCATQNKHSFAFSNSTAFSCSCCCRNLSCFNQATTMTRHLQDKTLFLRKFSKSATRLNLCTFKRILLFLFNFLVEKVLLWTSSVDSLGQLFSVFKRNYGPSIYEKSLDACNGLVNVSAGFKLL